MKILLQHISSCRQDKSGGCIECKETSNLIGIHTLSCKSKNCKVPRCELIKEKRKHKMQIEQIKTVKSTTAAATVKEDDTKTLSNDMLEQKIENVIFTTDQGDDEKWKPYVKLLEHASLCKSSKCAPNCAKMKESLQHNIASCRQRNCMSCKHVICLVRYHVISCKTNNCKVQMCNLVKEISRKLEDEKSDTGPTPAQAPHAASDITEEHKVTRQGVDRKIKALMNEDESLKAYRIAREKSIDDFTEAFEEFMLWSLSDEADLNPKKFAKQASGIAKLLIAGKISIETLLEKRDSTIASIEVQTKEYEYQQSLKLLLAGMKFESPKYQDEFIEQLDEALSRRNWDILGKPPILIFLYDSFQEVLSKWSSSSKLCLNDELIFITTSKIDFDESFTLMLQNVIRD
ncbi:hypothetical protein CTEN210_04302 [Chaetoceros tenuissimus]|uniref:histone acetyltransferase n=1 Tax=Chaetoceros tenuissimus TaxID=426638 RepID=A0AAD3CMU1_9STRA|nr:hypothetical protein CTEN210_04302 [Chaetoceros tenuissimus]